MVSKLLTVDTETQLRSKDHQGWLVYPCMAQTPAKSSEHVANTHLVHVVFKSN